MYKFNEAGSDSAKHGKACDRGLCRIRTKRKGRAREPIGPGLLCRQGFGANRLVVPLSGRAFRTCVRQLLRRIRGIMNTLSGGGGGPRGCLGNRQLCSGRSIYLLLGVDGQALRQCESGKLGCCAVLRGACCHRGSLRRFVHQCFSKRGMRGNGAGRYGKSRHVRNNVLSSSGSRPVRRSGPISRNGLARST